jgi:hypothetical protein
MRSEVARNYQKRQSSKLRRSSNTFCPSGGYRKGISYAFFKVKDSGLVFPPPSPNRRRVLPSIYPDLPRPESGPESEFSVLCGLGVSNPSGIRLFSDPIRRHSGNSWGLVRDFRLRSSTAKNRKIPVMEFYLREKVILSLLSIPASTADVA